MLMVNGEKSVQNNLSKVFNKEWVRIQKHSKCSHNNVRTLNGKLALIEEITQSVWVDA
jgi:hypothetical protein